MLNILTHFSQILFANNLFTCQIIIYLPNQSPSKIEKGLCVCMHAYDYVHVVLRCLNGWLQVNKKKEEL